jgi:hypothetical protein
VLDFPQAVPDGLEQVGEAGEGDVGQRAAFQRRPDSFHRVEVGGVGRELALRQSAAYVREIKSIMPNGPVVSPAAQPLPGEVRGH